MHFLTARLGRVRAVSAITSGWPPSDLLDLPQLHTHSSQLVLVCRTQYARHCRHLAAANFNPFNFHSCPFSTCAKTPRPTKNLAIANWSRVSCAHKVGMCGKQKFRSDSVLKTDPSKNLSSVETVSNRNCCYSNKKWIKVTLLALNVEIKNILKHDRNRVKLRRLHVRNI